MGADSQMPYLYGANEQSSRNLAYPYSHFNPKAVTEASYKRLSQQTTDTSKSKQEGPLINFNQHPDSYVVFDSRKTDHKPLPPRTKSAVKGVRWALFGVRLVQEIAALGLLVGTICMEGTSGGQTYLLRVPQAWDSLITLYAIYHLLRAAKARTPASSASYHTFALIMDTCLIPLYVYVTLAIANNRTLPVPEYQASGNIVPGDWRFTSVFSTQKATDLLLFCIFIGAPILAGLHLICCGMDIYLIMTFRHISKLPPDMNPLEDNLTRRERKHKYKDSDIINDLTDAEKKRLAHLSGSTLSVGNQSRLSVNSKSDNGDRTVPFNHSRTGSKISLAFSPHNPETARWSRHQYEGQQSLYQEAVESPRSRYTVRPDGKLEVRTRRGSRSPTKTRSLVVESRDLGTLNNSSQTKLDSTFADPNTIGRASNPDLPNATIQPSSIGQQQEHNDQSKRLLNDNWYVLDAEDDNYDAAGSGMLAAPMSRFSAAARNGYAPAPAHDRHDSFEPAGYSSRDAAPPKPLGMHPPTPPPADEQDYGSAYPDPDDTRFGEVSITRNDTQKTTGSSVYSESAPSLKSSKGTPKGKYYGDLAAATRGVRGSPQAQARGHGTGLLPSPQPSRTPSPEKKARVISRSGADIADESVLYLHPEESNSYYSMRSRRDVSGKVAEEGRGGNGWRGSWGSRG